MWDVTHACGHDQTHDLSPKRLSRRPRYAKWLATKDCSSCWARHRRELASERERDAGAGERSANEHFDVDGRWSGAELAGLPGSDRAPAPLPGCDTPVAWSRQLRPQLLAAARRADRLSEEVLTGRIETPAPAVTSVSRWTDVRGAKAEDLQARLSDAPVADAFSFAGGRY
jgi:hypothetical protein